MVAKDTSKPTVIPGQNITNILQGARSVRMDGSERSDTNSKSSASFFYDPPTLGLKSTQQLNVDWSKFQNHTFFGSAEVNVNVAFDQIINNYPFDGSRKEYEVFYEKLTGFEKFVLDSFPKNTGYLNFSGSTTSSFDGTYIVVNDYAGGKMPSLSKNKSGKPVLDPGLNSFSIEMQILPASQSNDNQVICQKLNGATQGFSLMLLSSSSPTTCNLQFAIVSGSGYLVSTASLTKGTFNHVVATFNRLQSRNVLQIYVNEDLKVESPAVFNCNPFSFATSPFIIGSGSLLQLGTASYMPTSTLSGSIDEFRFYHSVRTPTQIKKYARKNVYAEPDLKLYFKFNEPTGTLDGTQNEGGINSIVLDSSGQSLHSNISNFKFSLRSTGSVAPPIVYEKTDLSPILFPAHSDVIALNVRLLTSATAYDQINPNIITKLIPPHYFLEGQAFDGLGTETGTIVDQYGGNGQPGSGKLGTTQLLLSFLYVWAKFFDELKLFIDALSSVKYVSYDPLKSAPDHFLPLVIKQYGFQIPSMFLDATIEQYIDGEDIQTISSNDKFSLQYVQNQITRRVLANINEIIKSKGTQHSVRAFLRTIGIDPDNAFRIREFGGPTKQQLLHARETKLEPGLLLDFGNGGVVTSPFLTASRVEPGYPGSASPFVHPGVYYAFHPNTSSLVGTVSGSFIGTVGTASYTGSLSGSFTGSFFYTGIGLSGSFIFDQGIGSLAGTFTGLTGSATGSFTGSLSGSFKGLFAGNLAQIGTTDPFLFVTGSTPNSFTGSLLNGPSGSFLSLNAYPSLFPATLLSPNVNDGLFTSGSWTYEGIYQWPIGRGVTSFTQSLARIVTTGSQGQGLIWSVVALTSSIAGDQKPSVRLYGRPTVGSDYSQAPLLYLHIDDVNIFDGGRWNISFGRQRNDSIGSSVSSSYFLRVATQDYGTIKQLYSTSSYFLTQGTSVSSSDTLQTTGPYNASGSYLLLGNRATIVSTGSYFLNTSSAPPESQAGLFNGQLARVRFWTKALTMIEWKEHIKNYKSLGVQDPTTNFNFVTAKSGSWERLRLDSAMDQNIRVTDVNGAITLFDYSQNQLHLQGSNFPTSSQVINVTLWPYSFLSPVFDEASTNDKVRIRSFQSSDLAAEVPYAQIAPIYTINPNETPTDDTRFAIEFSLMDALNRDIINIFATLESLDNALGDPDLLFSPDYPTLEVMRNIYFNRLTDKINIKSFFEFYRWFDDSIGTFISQLIPQKTKFFGTNFVIESHMLERPKMEYGFNDIYLDESERHNQKQTLLVQQIVGTAVKY